jgi:hypothetical protein
VRNARIKNVRLVLEPREDGGLRIHSPDVPGLHLSGADRQHVWACVEPGIVRLLSANQGVEVLNVEIPRLVPGDSIDITLYVASE